MTRGRPHATTAASAMLAWLEDAHTAVDLGHALSPDHVLALAATPATAPHRLSTSTTTPRTWFLEEYERLMRQQLRDPVPMAGTMADLDAWRSTQSRRSEDLAQLVADHATCVVLSTAFVQRRPVSLSPRTTTRPPRRLTSADLALQTIHHERAA